MVSRCRSGATAPALLLVALGCAPSAGPARSAPADARDTARPADTGPPPDSGAPVDSGPPADSGAPADTAADTGTPTPPRVEILSPADGAEVENPVRFEVELAGVARATLDADGYALGVVDVPGVSTLTYTFSGVGYPRTLTLRGEDAAGATVATDTITVTVDAPGVELDVPYFYQYDNRNEPGATCGITSAAMVLADAGDATVTPDVLYTRYGKAQGQSPAGLAEIYAWEGLFADHGLSGTRAELRAHLDAGRPVVVHGYWTGAGHIAVLIGYTDSDWIVHDPAGDWSVCYGCGGGEAVRYPLGGAWDDAMSVDGDIWWSVGSPTAF